MRDIEIAITDADDNPVADVDEARHAMGQALGIHYEGQMERHYEDGCWLVELPEADTAELMTSGWWGRENEGGYNLEAEWPS